MIDLQGFNVSFCGVNRDRTFAINLLNINEIYMKEQAIVAKMSLGVKVRFYLYIICVSMVRIA